MGILSAAKNDLSGAVKSVKTAVKNFRNPPEPAIWIDEDLRPQIKVPASYLSDFGRTPPPPQATTSQEEPDTTSVITVTATTDRDVFQDFRDLGGILFPYTPTINMDNKAEYATQTPVHSNYQQYFYKNSSVGPIQVSGKFTVQDEYDGIMLLSTLHLLRSLTKMRFGNDDFAGSPPPICRFNAYGYGMLSNIPVTVASWKHELPDNVDYITISKAPKLFGVSHVPVLSTISIDLNIMYSRQEMLDHNVDSWLQGGLLNRGYL